jgi:hypothetical protein
LVSFAIPTTAINSPSIASLIPALRAAALWDRMQYSQLLVVLTAQRAVDALIREELLLRIPFDWEIGVVFQALGRKANRLSPRADRFNYRRRQKSERNHMAYVAITQAFPVRDLFG